jgi:hypothetical protein
MTGKAYVKGAPSCKENVMLTVIKEGDGLRPALTCVLCQSEAVLTHDWIAFKPLGKGEEVAAAEFVHRACLNGCVKQCFGTPHITLWRLSDVWRRLVELPS